MVLNLGSRIPPLVIVAGTYLKQFSPRNHIARNINRNIALCRNVLF